jgi:hypothetical protein
VVGIALTTIDSGTLAAGTIIPTILNLTFILEVGKGSPPCVPYASACNCLAPLLAMRAAQQSWALRLCPICSFYSAPGKIDNL